MEPYNKKIFVIIPAHNEAGGIESVLINLRAYPYEVVVIDDGSTDNTGQLAGRYVKVLRHPINRGQGAALVTGMEYACRQGADIIVHFDADGQMLAEEISLLIQPLIVDPDLDIVLGSRFLKPVVNGIPAQPSVPWQKKYLLQKPALIFQRLTTGLKLTDVHNGFRALTARAANRLRLTQDGMAHASEIVSEVKRLGLKYQEVPVTIIYREFGQGFSGGLRIIRDLIKRRLLK